MKPCQPFSVSGKGLGTDDPRHIFPHIVEAVRILRPKHVVLENVPGLLRRGFDSVLGALAEVGYDAIWTCLRASDIGAPHRRERVFIIATDGNAPGARFERPTVAEVQQQELGERRDAAADAGGERLGEHPRGSSAEEAWALSCDEPGDHHGEQPPIGWGPYHPAIARWERTVGRAAPAPTEPGAKGQPFLSPRFVEWMMGLGAGWVTDVPDLSRRQQLTILGNGVVPQQAKHALVSLGGLGN